MGRLFPCGTVGHFGIEVCIDSCPVSEVIRLAWRCMRSEGHRNTYTPSCPLLPNSKTSNPFRATMQIVQEGELQYSSVVTPRSHVHWSPKNTDFVAQLPPTKRSMYCLTCTVIISGSTLYDAQGYLHRCVKAGLIFRWEIDLKDGLNFWCRISFPAQREAFCNCSQLISALLSDVEERCQTIGCLGIL